MLANDLMKADDDTMPAGLAFLSPAEFRIFSLLSRRGPFRIGEIKVHLGRLHPEFRQGYNTIGTLLKRLIQKGYVEQRDEGQTAHLFYSIVPYDRALSWHVERFLDSFLITSRADLRTMLDLVADRLTAAKW